MVHAFGPPAVDLVAELSRPYTHGLDEPAAVSVHETHCSWVFLAGERALKVKKPVTFPFLDYGTLELRRLACEREVVLNRRLAPDIYLGVRALVRSDGTLRTAPADAPEAVEYAVEMRRFDERDTLAARMAAGDAKAGELRAVGEWVAAFHAGAEAVPRTGAEPAMHELAETFITLAGSGRPLADLARFAAAFLGARGQDLDERARRGLVRDGHGDLRAEHVLVTSSGIAAVDCVEFSDALRQADVGADLSFLVMDVMRLGGDAAVRELLAGYRAAGGDPGDDALVAFHAAARALVRAKVALLRSRQPRPAGDAARQASAECDAHIALASRLAWRARGPVIVAVEGVAASGKSTLARALAARSGLPVVESDEVRKELAGIAAHERGGPELYDAAHDDATYAELVRRAQTAVEASSGAIVAATFRTGRHRSLLAETARKAGARLLVVECLVPELELLARAARRARAADDVSDAGPSVVDRHLHEREPFDDVPARAHLPIRADRPVHDLVAAVEDALDRRHAGTVVTR